MIAAFGQSFFPDALRGWRAEQFSEREDRFQQLIGDAVREVHGASAHVSPTLGRDGSIDAWVEQLNPACHLLGNLSGPVVIECKDHQEQPTWPVTWRNIQAGWSKVRSKLEQRAAEGFTGKFEPWQRAATYVYCVSAAIPDQRSKDDLTSNIKAFLQTVAPHIQNVVVCDWGTLSFWLNQQRRIADSWLGIGHPGVVDHLLYVNSLTGIRKYLLNENLAYEEPEADADTHPQILWEHLAAGNADRQPGLILHGPGGVGKTRLCLEVAQRAYSEGWRVLHISPTEESLSERELAAVIATGDRPTLLCLDYIDMMQGTENLLDGARLVRELASRGIRLLYLANSRPRWAQDAMRDAAAQATFQFRELRPTEEQNGRLLKRMIGSVAPTALEKWDYQELRRVCGRRPIIALFIAREIEDGLRNQQLDQDELAAVVAGDLSVWLRRRLAQDELKIEKADSVWKKSGPSNEMVGACAALVAAPNTREVLVQSVATVLRALGSSTDPDFVVSRLEEMGWLELQGSWFATPHDVVTDEVLDQVVRDRDAIRAASLEAVLSLWECEPSAIGRLSTALQRWLGAMPDGQPAAAKAQAASVQWLRSHADKIGKLLATGDPDRSGFAVGAILRWQPWSTAASDCWDALLSPWIAVYGGLREARHFYYVGLRDNSVAPRLISPAVAWIAEFQLEKEAGYVIRQLLELRELENQQLELAVGCTLMWLSRYKFERDAQFVLHAVLGRKELQAEQHNEVTGYALAWLAHFPREKETRFVLGGLLGREEFRGDRLHETFGHALTWLLQFPLEDYTGFVLRPLLKRSELHDERSERVIRHTLAWLAQFRLEKDAEYVLSPLLDRDDLHTERLNEALGYALAWVAKFKLEKGTGRVLPSLLGRSELRAERLRDTMNDALLWLGKFGLEKEARFVLPPLLGRSELQGEQLDAAIAFALAWLSEYPLEKDAAFALSALLGRNDLTGPALTVAVERALDWLPVYLDTEASEFVLARMLPRSPLPEDKIGALKKLAMEKLRLRVRQENDEGVSFLLRPWLHCRVRHPDLDREIISLACEWLRFNPQREGADFVSNRILRRRDVSEADWLFAAQVAFAWLGAADRNPRDADYAINSLFTRPELLPYDLLAGTVRMALRLLPSLPKQESRGYLQTRLLRGIKHLPPHDRLVRGVNAFFERVHG